MNRRRFLALLGLGALMMLAVVITAPWLKQRLLASSGGRRFREMILGVDTRSGTSQLTEAEERSLWALASAILPSDAGEAARPVIMDRLRWRAALSPGYADEFRRALALLDRESHKLGPDRESFDRLSTAEAGTLIGGLLDGIVAHELSAAPRSDLVRLALSSDFRRRYRMRRHVVNEILDAYYRSPLSWARLGYRSFPGACAGLTIYSTPPEPDGRPS